MERLLVLIARALIALLQALPLTWVARLGRAGGGLAYVLDARHRRVAIENLRQCFGAELSPPAIRRLARENFRRVGENFSCAVRTAALSAEQIPKILTVSGGDRARAALADRARGVVVAIGHFGNFELYARANQFVPGFQFATTYRALRQPALNALLQDLRERSGCLYFERRSDASALREAMNSRRVMLGLLADQHAGDRGLPVPFFGRECSTSAAPAVLALRYHCPLHVAVCYRTGLARWSIEIGDEIPTVIDGHPRPIEDIARDMNQAYEVAVRRDPANWFWVHRRWKTVHRRPRPAAPAEANGPQPVAEDAE